MPDEVSAKLIVTATGLLITLAADCLDYLLYPGTPVYVPDAVLFEATRDRAAFGAQQVLDWVQAHSDQVHTISTEVFFHSRQSQEASPGRREKDPGESAAIEALHDEIRLAVVEMANLTTEDDRVLRHMLTLGAERSAKIIPITTRDLLTAMEGAGRINSADEVCQRAQDAGRMANRRAALQSQYEHARQAVERLLKKRGRSH